MSIIRVDHDKNNPYVILNKKGLEDPDLSWAAKGLWAYLMSKPDHWEVSVTHLSKIYDGKGGGERAIYSLLTELIENGYCIREQKNEEGSFGKVEYSILEFKKCLPRCSQADARDADARKSDYSNKGPEVNNETTTTSQEFAVVFSCLEKLDIQEHEKIWLSKNYTEKQVEHAVSYATSLNIRIRTSLIQTIKWACEKQPEIPLSKDESKEANKELAEKVHEDALIPEGCQFEVLNKGIEICFNGSPQVFVLNYTDTNFKEKFKEALKTYRIYPK